MTATRSWGVWKRYGEAARQDVHQLLAWGFTDVRDDLTIDHDEPSISGLIAAAIYNRLITDAPSRFDRYFVADDLYQSDDPSRTGISRRRADIVVEISGPRPRLRYIFEAKRLRKGHHPISAYVGSDGIGRFVTGAYAAEATEAGMVAYVQSPQVTDWESELCEVFRDPTYRKALRVRTGLDRQQVIAALPNTWVSSHDRTSAPTLTLYHLFLECFGTHES